MKLEDYSEIYQNYIRSLKYSLKTTFVQNGHSNILTYAKENNIKFFTQERVDCYIVELVFKDLEESLNFYNNIENILFIEKHIYLN